MLDLRCCQRLQRPLLPPLLPLQQPMLPLKLAAMAAAAMVAALTVLLTLLLALPMAAAMGLKALLVVTARQGLCLTKSRAALAPRAPALHCLQACALLRLLLLGLVLLLQRMCAWLSRRLQACMLPLGMAATATAAMAAAVMGLKALPMVAVGQGLCMRKSGTALAPRVLLLLLLLTVALLLHSVCCRTVHSWEMAATAAAATAAAVMGLKALTMMAV